MIKLGRLKWRARTSQPLMNITAQFTKKSTKMTLSRLPSDIEVLKMKRKTSSIFTKDTKETSPPF